MDEKDNEQNSGQDGGGAPEEREAPKKKGGAKKAVIITVVAAAVLILATVGSGLLIVHHYLGQIEYVDPADTQHDVLPGSDFFFTDEELGPIAPPETSPVTDGTDGIQDGTETAPPETDVQWPDIGELPKFDDDKLINILIVGQDRRAGEGRQRSDTMILVSINPETNNVSLISFLRDLYVQIPGGYMDNRLNTAYVWGGFQLLKDTLCHNFGVTVDGCFECDFFDFIDIIDLLGGVEMDVTQAEADHMRYSMGVEVPVGRSNLNGEQALAYARIRYIDSDFQRTDRQRKILLSLFNKFKNAGVSELKSIADEILPKLATDLTVNERWGLLMQLLPVVSRMKVSSYSVPFEGAYTSPWIRGMWVLLPDLGKIREKLANEYLPL